MKLVSSKPRYRRILFKSADLRKTHICCYFIVFLILLIRNDCYSQNPKLKFHHLSTENGLKENTVFDIIKDYKGYMWFGTSSGLCRYDGYTFKNYMNNPLDKNTLKEEVITNIIEDQSKNLWVTSFGGGIHVYDRKYDRFKYISLADSLSDIKVIELYADTKNNLWFATAQHGIIRYNPKSGKCYTYLQDKPATKCLYTELIYGITEDYMNNIWFLTEKRKLIKYNPSENSFKMYVYDADYKDVTFVPFQQNFMVDSKNTIWYGTQTHGLIEFNPHTEEFSFYNLEDRDHHIIYSVTSIVEKDSDQLWIGTNHGGLFLFDKNTKKIQNYVHNPLDVTSLSNNQIMGLYKDDTEIIWVGLHTGGVDYFYKQDQNFTIYKDNESKYGPSNNAILEIYEDKENNIWIGTDGGGLNKFDPQKKTFRYYQHNKADPQSLSSDVITAMHEDSKGRFWVGTFKNGLNLLNRKTGKCTHFYYSISDSTTVGQSIWSIIEDKDHTLWFGTLYQGLNKYNEKDNTFIRYIPFPNTQPFDSRNNMEVLFEDSKGMFWLGTNGGLGIFDKEKEKFRFFTYNAEDTTSISHNLVECIFEDKQHRLWIGTKKGLNLLNYKNFTFTRYSISEIPSQNSIQSIEEDAHGNLWLSTYGGLIKFTPDINKFIIFNSEDGLQSDVFSSTSSLNASDGTLYFGGIKGFNIFHPDSLIENTIIPPIVITGLYINNKFVTRNSSESVLNKTISETESIELNYKQNYLSFDYVALNYKNTVENKYAYYLEGLEDDWIYVNDRRKAIYTDLKPGKYTFHVKGCNNNGYWNEAGASLNIYIKPPFWQTLAFQIFIILLIIFSLYSFYIVRVKRINKQKIILKKLVDESTKELQVKNLVLEKNKKEIEQQAHDLEIMNENLEAINSAKDKFFSVIAHDLKNPLNSIAGYVELLKYKKGMGKERKEKYIDRIENSVNIIISLLNNLLDWARTQTGRINYEPKILQLNDLIKENISILNGLYVRKEIDLIFNSDKEILVKADKNMLSTILRNILDNAIKFTSPNGSITIDVKKKDSYVIISISDTGVGIRPEDQDDIFDITKSNKQNGTEGEKGTGLGLILCKEFIHKMKGEIWLESEPGVGSTFYFTLPLNEK